jgi:hypothetical protein
MTCHCHDPYVFGHITCRGETQPWTQPPLHTYTTGETFTIRSGGIIMPAHEAAHTIRNLTQALQTGWNCRELPQTHPRHAEHWGTAEPCA